MLLKALALEHFEDARNIFNNVHAKLRTALFWQNRFAKQTITSLASAPLILVAVGHGLNQRTNHIIRTRRLLRGRHMGMVATGNLFDTVKPPTEDQLCRATCFAGLHARSELDHNWLQVAVDAVVRALRG